MHNNLNPQASEQSDTLKVAIDIDNVLCDSDSFFRDAIRQVSGGLVDLRYEDVVHFDYTRCADSAGNRIDASQWREAMQLFQESRTLLQLNEIPGAIASARLLCSRFECCFLTSRHPSTADATKEWLETRLGSCTNRLFFSEPKCKHEHAQRFNVAIEDDLLQAISYANCGTRVLLLGHPWNANAPLESSRLLHRTMDWAGILRELVVVEPQG